jgi:prepilin-type processing-associated H-X9-DG protein
VDDTGAFPTLWCDNKNPYTSTSHWDSVLLPDLSRNCALFWCPANNATNQWTNITLFNGSYGYNAAGTAEYYSPRNAYSLGLGGDTPDYGHAPPLPLCEARVIVPSDMIAIGDYPSQSIYLDPATLSAQDGDISISQPNDQGDTLTSRHDLGSNVLFCDGHVEYASQTNWLQATTRARQRWNNDNQPHPDSW